MLSLNIFENFRRSYVRYFYKYQTHLLFSMASFEIIILLLSACSSYYPIVDQMVGGLSTRPNEFPYMVSKNIDHFII